MITIKSKNINVTLRKSQSDNFRNYILILQKSTTRQVFAINVLDISQDEGYYTFALSLPDYFNPGEYTYYIIRDMNVPLVVFSDNILSSYWEYPVEPVSIVNNTIQIVNYNCKLANGNQNGSRKELVSVIQRGLLKYEIDKEFITFVNKPLLIEHVQGEDNDNSYVSNDGRYLKNDSYYIVNN